MNVNFRISGKASNENNIDNAFQGQGFFERKLSQPIMARRLGVIGQAAA